MNKQIMFGTDGIRGNASEYPFTQEGLYRIGSAIGDWAVNRYKRVVPRMLIASDPRDSGMRIKQQLISGLQRSPLDIIDGFILPTPAVCQLIHLDDAFDFGIVISASHNPYFDNGIKIFNAATYKLSVEDEKSLLKVINNQSTQVTDSIQGKHSFWRDAKQCYCENFANYFKKDFLSGLTIVLDCANGVASYVARVIFEQFGARVITIADTPDGKNINDRCGALHPEFLSDFITQYKADIGFSFDGDGDRIVCVTKDGEIKDGDDLLYLLATHPEYNESGEIVGTVMSNSGLEERFIEEGKKFSRAAVGDKYVFAALEEKSLVLGGEPSGHLIARDYLGSGDGIFVALRVLESIIYNDNWDVQTFKKKPNVLLNVKTERRDDLSKGPYAEIIKRSEQRLRKGRVFVRFSGTEDIIRIMVEDIEFENAQSIAQDLSRDLADALAHKTV